jgi:hypothetical protein
MLDCEAKHHGILRLTAVAVCRLLFRNVAAALWAQLGQQRICTLVDRDL